MIHGVNKMYNTAHELLSKVNKRKLFKVLKSCYGRGIPQNLLAITGISYNGKTPFNDPLPKAYSKMLIFFQVVQYHQRHAPSNCTCTA